MRRITAFVVMVLCLILFVLAQTVLGFDVVAITGAVLRWVRSLVMYQVDRIWNEVLNRDWVGLLVNPFNAAITGIYLFSLVIEIGIHGWQKRSIDKGWHASSLYRLSRMVGNKTARTDFYMFVYNRLALDAFVMQALMLLGPLFVFALVQANLNFNLFANVPNPVVQFMIYLVVQDFIYY